MTTTSLFGSDREDLPTLPCMHCGANVTWVRNIVNDHLFPLDVAPSPRGRFRVERIDVDPAGGLRVPWVRWLKTKAHLYANTRPLHRPHAATCSQPRWVIKP